VVPVDEEAPVVRSLTGLRKAENECRRCPLYKNATQAVPGEGPSHVRVMLVGEQPGDKEDLAGKPFVGPAGRILDKALADAGIPRDETFVTNAVKHFKFEPRGKRACTRSRTHTRSSAANGGSRKSARSCSRS
jgi:uracil-DNA glycosylase